jgi:hypothetical protein
MSNADFERQYGPNWQEVVHAIQNVAHGKPSCGFDMEQHASSYNEGYRDAMMQSTSNWPGLWTEGDEQPLAETVIEWAVQSPGGIHTITGDRAEAEEDVQWIVDGELVQRLRTTTDWQTVEEES